MLHDVANQIGLTHVDLIQYPSTYFFRAPSERLSLPAVLPRLRRAVTRGDVPPEARTAAEAVRSSLDALADTLRRGPYGLHAGDRRDVLSAYAADHPR